MTVVLYSCPEFIGVAMGGRLRGDERRCGRPATYWIAGRDDWKPFVQVCGRHLRWYRNHGYVIREVLP